MSDAPGARRTDSSTETRGVTSAAAATGMVLVGGGDGVPGRVHHGRARLDGGMERQAVTEIAGHGGGAGHAGDGPAGEQRRGSAAGHDGLGRGPTEESGADDDDRLRHLSTADSRPTIAGFSHAGGVVGVMGGRGRVEAKVGGPRSTPGRSPPGTVGGSLRTTPRSRQATASGTGDRHGHHRPTPPRSSPGPREASAKRWPASWRPGATISCSWPAPSGRSRPWRPSWPRPARHHRHQHRGRPGRQRRRSRPRHRAARPGAGDRHRGQQRRVRRLRRVRPRRSDQDDADGGPERGHAHGADPRAVAAHDRAGSRSGHEPGLLHRRLPPGPLMATSTTPRRLRC